MHTCSHLDDVIIPWESTNRVDFVAQSFLDSRLQYESLKGLMDFLAFVVEQLWYNNRLLIREISTNPLGNSLQNWGLLAITLAPETLGSRSRALKTPIAAFSWAAHLSPLENHAQCVSVSKIVLALVL